MTICNHCRQHIREHVDLKCLFLPTKFATTHCADCGEPLSAYPPPKGQAWKSWFRDPRNNDAPRHHACAFSADYPGPPR